MNNNETPYLIKYKPKEICDFFIDIQTKDLIENFINQNNLNIILYGNNESGKTSLVQTIYNTYYKDINNNLLKNNLMIMNPLLEQGINYCRNEVKIFCQSKSNVINKKKMFIFDDIDIANEQIQQIIRNFIDKYSNNINFILTCSNLQKVNSNIKSRLITLKLNNVNNNHLSKLYDKIKINENIQINDNVKNHLIKLCNFSFRTLICYLEKFKIYNENIDIDTCNILCTNIDYSLFDTYTKYIINYNLINSLKIIHNIFESGYSVIDILDSYINFIKVTKLINEEDKYEVIIIISKFNLNFYNIHEDEIELTFFTNNLLNYFKNKSVNKNI